MSGSEAPPPHGVADTAPAREPPTVLHARPLQDPVDWDAILGEIERDFPKTLTRLAE